MLPLIFIALLMSRMKEHPSIIFLDYHSFLTDAKQYGHPGDMNFGTAYISTLSVCRVVTREYNEASVKALLNILHCAPPHRQQAMTRVMMTCYILDRGSAAATRHKTLTHTLTSSITTALRLQTTFPTHWIDRESAFVTWLLQRTEKRIQSWPSFIS